MNINTEYDCISSLGNQTMPYVNRLVLTILVAAITTSCGSGDAGSEEFNQRQPISEQSTSASAVSDFTAKLQDDGSVKLQWPSTNQYASYDVYRASQTQRSLENVFRYIATVDEPRYVDGALLTSVTYDYQVRLAGADATSTSDNDLVIVADGLSFSVTDSGFLITEKSTESAFILLGSSGIPVPPLLGAAIENTGDISNEQSGTDSQLIIPTLSQSAALTPQPSTDLSTTETETETFTSNQKPENQAIIVANESNAESAGETSNSVIEQQPAIEENTPTQSPDIVVVTDSIPSTTEAIEGASIIEPASSQILEEIPETSETPEIVETTETETTNTSSEEENSSGSESEPDPAGTINVDQSSNTGDSVTVAEPSTSTDDLDTAYDLANSVDNLAHEENGEVLSFPGAQGYGRFAKGGRGGQVVIVNTTEDIVDSSDNLISVREALEVMSGPRTIVFEVGGVFELEAQENDLRRINMVGEADSFVTIACQTAPNPGVILKIGGIRITGGAHDIIMRHCIIRGIDEGSYGAGSGRNITVSGSNSRDMIFDHLSLSWATDENFQIYADPNVTAPISNITLSNSVVVEGDADSNHPNSKIYPAWYSHSMGPSCNVNSADFRTEACSIINSFIAHNAGRNGMIWGGSGELMNNIVYNWYSQGHTVRPQSGSDVDAHLHNNLFKRGPQTASSDSPMYIESGSTARVNATGNFLINRGESLLDASDMGTKGSGTPNLDPVTSTPVSILEMAEEGGTHLNCVGASKPLRDAVDTRVIKEFHAGNGQIGIGSHDVPSGWFDFSGPAHASPSLHNQTVQRDYSTYGANTRHQLNYDTDKDGMADAWEIQRGLNMSDPSDFLQDDDGDGYTNLEEFINEMAFCS